MTNIKTTLALCAGVAAALAASAHAQDGRLFGAERYATLPGSGGAELHPADLNGDGHTDLVVLENGAGGFSVHLGDGNGGYALLGSHSLVDGSQSLQLADINADGVLDVVVREAFQRGSTLTVFLGTGGGEFGPGQTNNFGLIEVEDIRIADVNGDDLPDLVAITFDDPAFTNVLNVLPGLPAGSANFFGAPETFRFPAFATREISIVEVNGDSAPDLVITASSSNNTHQVFLNDGTGTFNPTGQGEQNAGGSLLSRTQAADMDGDGNADLVYAVSQFGDPSTAQVGVLPGDGTGGFGAPVLTDFGLSGLLSVVLSDFNSDGNVDVAGPNFINDALVWLPGNGDLTFGAAVYGGSGGAPFDAVLLDADEDGIDDLVVLNISSDDFAVHLGTGGDDFFETPRVNEIGAGATGVAVADLTGDGLVEAITANSVSGTLSVLSRLDGTVFATGFEVSDGIVDPVDVTVGDVNGDDLPDVIVADRIQDAALVLIGDGGAGLSAPVVLPACNAPTRVGAGDLDGDGTLDLVVACIGSDDIAVLLGDGLGGFSQARLFPGVDEPQSMIVADINGDEALDILLADSSFDTPGVSALFGVGDGSFDPPALVAPSFVIAAIALGDVNNDGTQDLAMADLQLGTRIALGTGNGLFGLPLTVPGATQPIDVGFLDADNDGFDDVVSLHVGGGRRDRGASVARSLGDGTFEADRVFAVATGVDALFAEPGVPRTLNVVDVNADGLRDIVVSTVAAEFNGGLSVDLNRSGNDTLPDTDGDGVADAVDNCSLLANADQRDTDGDGFGNRCDPDLNNDNIVNVIDLGLLRAAFFSSDADPDFDGDGIVNVVDLGILRSFFFQPPGPGATQ